MLYLAWQILNKFYWQQSEYIYYCMHRFQTEWQETFLANDAVHRQNNIDTKLLSLTKLEQIQTYVGYKAMCLNLDNKIM